MVAFLCLNGKYIHIISVTCKIGLKVPFAVTGHIWLLLLRDVSTCVHICHKGLLHTLKDNGSWQFFLEFSCSVFTPLNCHFNALKFYYNYLFTKGLQVNKLLHLKSMHPKPKLSMFCAMYTFCVYLKIINTVLKRNKIILKKLKKMPFEF